MGARSVMLTTEKRSKTSAIPAKYGDPSQYIGTYVPPVPPCCCRRRFIRRIASLLDVVAVEAVNHGENTREPVPCRTISSIRSTRYEIRRYKRPDQAATLRGVVASTNSPDVWAEPGSRSVRSTPPSKPQGHRVTSDSDLLLLHTVACVLVDLTHVTIINHHRLTSSLPLPRVTRAE
ncbi:hypothetical protein Y032_0023g720 [Ancylostoma ceylanicum]|uniref:Uncharacterized protein n=1 Tax=Ancylostoma ceylanicum TaxID=53326 RepID=A0A016UX54_9BILA|nr:hypothetical protein Y032_0023g720 [Ancylostoma ceylanicum]